MSATPVEAVTAAVEHALFGAEEGGLVSDDASLPVGELRRLLSETAGPRIGALIAEAEKRGAVGILRLVADRTERQRATGMPLAKTADEAMTQAIDSLRRIADRTERDGIPGEVTL